jgi:hypothetical protein
MSSKFGFTLLDSSGNPQAGLIVQVKVAGTATVAASTSDDSLTDNGDGTYTTAAALANGSYSVYSGSGSGTLVPGLDSVPHVSSDLVPSAIPVAVTQGGTGATSASQARTNLGLAIGTNVQAYSAYLTAAVSGMTWWFANDDAGPTLLFLNNGSWGAYAGAAALSALGCGTAAKIDVTTTGEASKIAQHTDDSAYYLPERSSHLDAIAANHGKMYRYRSVAGGVEGVYYIGQTGTAPNTYAVKTIETHTITGA